MKVGASTSGTTAAGLAMAFEWRLQRRDLGSSGIARLALAFATNERVPNVTYCLIATGREPHDGRVAGM